MGKQFDTLLKRPSTEPIGPMEREKHRTETIRRIESGLQRLTEEVAFQEAGIAEAMTDSNQVSRERRLREWEAWGSELRTAIAYLKVDVTDLPLADRSDYSQKFDSLWQRVRATRRPEGQSGPTTKIHSRRK